MTRRLRVQAITHFRFGDEIRELRDPDGAPTARQLHRLNNIGALAIVEIGQVGSITKGEAAAAIDALKDEAAA